MLMMPMSMWASGDGIVVDAADFDGTNDYMTRGAGLTGAADSKLLTQVIWFRLDGTAGNNRFIHGATTVGGGTSRFRSGCTAVGPGLMEILGLNAAGSTVLSVRSTTALSDGEGIWRCMMASFDLSDTGKRNLYFGDVDELDVVTYTDDSIDFTLADWAVGALAAGTFKWDGCLAEVWFAPGQYLDFSVEANRRKFITAGGKPANLGADGSLPTGTAPLIYLHLNNGEAVENFATNRGTGGSFSITGTLDTASTSPSD